MKDMDLEKVLNFATSRNYDLSKATTLYNENYKENRINACGKTIITIYHEKEGGRMDLITKQ